MARKKKPPARVVEPRPADLPAAFYAKLEADLDDTVTLRALADWYEEQGQADAAACLRWAADSAHHPYRYRHDGSLTVSSDAWHKDWLWWAKEDPDYGNGWGHPPSCRLPEKVWKHLKHTFDYSPAVFKEYETAQGAWEAFFAIWSKARATLVPRKKSNS